MATPTKTARQKLIQPLPWRAEPLHAALWCVLDAKGFVVLSDVTQDEAELIVTAVNAHDDVVKALRLLLGAYIELAALVGVDVCSPQIDGLREQVNVALAKVEDR